MLIAKSESPQLGWFDGGESIDDNFAIQIGSHANGGHGEHGSSRYRNGANGMHKTILVPEGVYVYRMDEPFALSPEEEMDIDADRDMAMANFPLSETMESRHSAEGERSESDLCRG